MPVVDWLKQVGGRLGIVRVVSTTAPAPPEKVPTRVVTLKELMTELRGEDVRALAELPAELTCSFDRVYEAAGIPAPEHGWTIERLKEFLRAATPPALPREEMQKRILQALAADQAHVHELVKDAIARDQALDAFELFVRAKMDTRAAERQKRVGELTAKIRDLEAQVARLGDEARADETRWDEWHTRKVAAEKEMARALAYLVEEPVVSVDEPPAK